jgi:hypothetical protein
MAWRNSSRPAAVARNGRLRTISTVPACASRVRRRCETADWVIESHAHRSAPGEIKNHEYRVGLTPASVRELVAHGHAVLVQSGAGAAIGLTDAHYQAAGATSRPMRPPCSRRPT